MFKFTDNGTEYNVSFRHGWDKHNHHMTRCQVTKVADGSIVSTAYAKYNPGDAKLHLPFRREIGRGISIRRVLVEMFPENPEMQKTIIKLYRSTLAEFKAKATK